MKQGRVGFEFGSWEYENRTVANKIETQEREYTYFNKEIRIRSIRIEKK